ncbi:MAG TPA: zinc-dependent metalloprotease family protein [Rubricoccaceae bacterium]|jgi:hypothetical protein
MPSFARVAALAAAVGLLVPSARAQSDGFWSDAPSVAALGAPATATTAGRTLRLDRDAMAARLATAPAEAAGLARGADVPVPMPDGGVLWFRVAEAPVMAPALQARYPEIRTYTGQGRDVPSATVRLSLTPAGFAAMAFTPGGTVYVDPYARTTANAYLAYYAADAVMTEAQHAARAAEALLDAPGEATGPATLSAPLTSNGTTFRTYRLAMAATGEYTAFHGGTVGGALAAIVQTMNRVNQVYERDLSVRMELVANNDLIIYTNAATDPFANTSSDLGANQSTIDAVIGTANYDIGHLVGTGGGGVAGLGVVCGTSKARGLTGSPSPTGDAFDIDYVAHEIGHQFRGDHTFNSTTSNCSGNRSGTAAYEPGSGSTIMAYAGICGSANLQTFSDPYFHAVSLQQISGFIQNGGGSTCGATAPTNNDIPVVTAPSGITIPVRTPFTLTGAATDATPAALTYTWEEYDLGPASSPANNGVPTGPPFFRSFNPVPSPSRTFPQLTRLLAGQAPVRGEALPIDTRTLNFRLTARDNRAGGGAIGDVTISLLTDAGAGPFTVTAPATGATLFTSTPVTVTWNVANTDALDDLGVPDLDFVDVENVEIRYSADNGVTFETVVASTPNDGSAEVLLPGGATSQGRIVVAAVGNVFFNVNPGAFSVFITSAGDDRASATTGLSAVAPNPASGTATFTLGMASSEPVRVAVYDALGRAVALVHDGPAVSGQAFTVDVSRLPAGVYVVRAAGASVQSAQRFTVVR